MKILALEFSSDQRSVAIVDDGQVLGRGRETATRAGRPLGLVESALREAGLERELVECLAVGLGPGSYTGIRSAIALAQGWQLARGTRILGISSVECLAAQAQEEKIYGRVHLIIDAQRNEFYLANYEIGGAGCREAEPLRLAGRNEVLALARGNGTAFGPGISKWFSGGRELFPDAAMLGQLAGRRSDFLPGERLEPIYLRETSFVRAPPPRITPAA
jgi:tRNA threonylcarbamoyladenosine biosynthesis protein TsaB